jgi:hypothetical protein
MSSVIQEFLVALGFHVDPASQKKFTEALGKNEADVRKSASATEAEIKRSAAANGRAVEERAAAIGRNVAAFVTIASAAALGAVTAIEKIAKSFDELYYASQRSGASAENIKALKYALSQSGGSAQEAGAAIDAFGKALRTNPGNAGLINSLGVATSAGGKARDTLDVLLDTVGALKRTYGEAGSLNYGVGQSIAEDLGIPENLYLAQDADLRKRIEEHRKKASALGLDPDAAAKSGQAFMQQWRSLSETIAIIVEKIATDSEGSLTGAMAKVEKWLQEHLPQIQKGFEQLGTAVSGLVSGFGKIADAMSPAFDAFDRMSRSLLGDDQGGLKTAFQAFLLYLLATWIPGVRAAILGLNAAILATPLGRLLLGTAAIAGGIAAGGQAAEEALKGGSYSVDPNTGMPVPNNGQGLPGGQSAPAAPSSGWGAAGEWLRRQLGGGAGPAPSAGPAASGAPPLPPPRPDLGGQGQASGPRDDRTLWQRIAPKALGGRDAPAQALGEGDPLISLIRRKEGTTGDRGFNTSLANGALLPGGKDTTLTDKTFREIYDIQTGMLAHPGNRWNSSALGVGQFVRSTLFGKRGTADNPDQGSLAGQLGIGPNDKFDQATQLRMMDHLIKRRGRDATALGNEWEGLQKFSNSDEILRAYDARQQMIASGKGATPGPANAAQADASGNVLGRLADGASQLYKSIVPSAQASARSGFDASRFDAVSKMAASVGQYDFSKAMLGPSEAAVSNDNSRSVAMGDTNVTINANGADAGGIARDFERVVPRVNADRLRNLQGAVR